MSSPFVLSVDSRAVGLALDDYLLHPDEGGGELARIARQHQVLPLWADMGGCIALRPNGQLVFLAWDDPEKVEPVGAAGDHDRRMVHAARAAGSRRYPSIAGLAPVRPVRSLPFPTTSCANAAGSVGSHGEGRAA